MEYGLQLYSMRDMTAEDLQGALQHVAALGYRYVEFAGFFGHPAQKVKEWLTEYGLQVSGTHTGWQEIADHFEETLAYHQTIGNKNIIIPGADLKTREKLDAFIQKVHENQPKLT
ncbi:MAG: sugar phosphate isomerase/epimerase, partial [Clostridia bacterium]